MTDQAEGVVRRILHRLGYRFRLDPGLPGCPALALPRWRLAVFVVDCAGTPHPECRHAAADLQTPDRCRDPVGIEEASAALARAGWDSLVVYACEAEDPVALGYRLDIALQGRLIAARGLDADTGRAPSGAGPAAGES